MKLTSFDFVTEINTENTGGNCMVTTLTLADGRVLGITDESVVLYKNMDDFNSHEGNDNPFIDLTAE